MSAADLRTVKPLGKEVTYDPDMPMGVIKALMRAGQESDLEQMQIALSKIVTTWDFDGDPTSLDAWDDLRRSEFLAITSEVMEDMGKLGED